MRLPTGFLATASATSQTIWLDVFLVVAVACYWLRPLRWIMRRLRLHYPILILMWLKRRLFR